MNRAYHPGAPPWGYVGIVGRQSDTICLWTGAGVCASTGIQFDLGPRPRHAHGAAEEAPGRARRLGRWIRLGEGSEALESQIVRRWARAIHRRHEWSAAGVSSRKGTRVACSVADR